MDSSYNSRDFEGFERELESIRKRLDEIDDAREELLKLSREMRRKATLAISSIHMRDVRRARELLREAREILRRINAYRECEIYYPITRDSMQELVEGEILLKIVSENRLEIPHFDVEVHPSSILTGIADAVGELRRYILDLLRKSEIEEAERLIKTMEKIYFSLISFNYPDKIVPGLKSKMDMIRLSLERTKSDLISAMIVARFRDSDLDGA